MLCLRRQLQESILIGPDVKITIIELNRHFVRLGIEAPREVDIMRLEVAARRIAPSSAVHEQPRNSSSIGFPE